jgi:hypothetical protein
VRVHHCVRALACFAIGLAIPSDSCGGDLKPYPLPPEARTGVEKLAASSDVLLLGEQLTMRCLPCGARGMPQWRLMC